MNIELQTDIRDTDLYREIECFYRDLHSPGFGRVSGASQPSVSPNGDAIAFTGSILDGLTGAGRSEICVFEIRTQTMYSIANGSWSDNNPKWSPDGRQIAFLSDRTNEGVFKPYIVDQKGACAPQSLPDMQGVVEFLAWSPDGKRMLFVVAGYGADTAGMQGATTTGSLSRQREAWMATVDSGDEENKWRHLWTYDVSTGECSKQSPVGANIWEAAWLGNDKILIVTSSRPEEAAWYDAELMSIDLRDGGTTVLAYGKDQIALPSANLSGSCIAYVDALCSDRMVVAGDLYVLDPDQPGSATMIPACDVSITHIAWRDDRKLVLTGQRDFETVICEFDAVTGNVEEIWASEETHCGFWYPEAAPCSEDRVIIIGESYLSPPTLLSIGRESTIELYSFTHEGFREFLSGGKLGSRVEKVIWEGRDRLEIQGWLILPPGEGPFATIMEVHGGPVWCNRNRWMGGVRAEPQAFVHKGYAVFRPNPRGSGGRGQDFARHVKGDMGGEDTYDLLAGLDTLVRRGITDPSRIGVIGVSYGGFMSSWIITQDSRFAAAIPISPVTDWRSMHWTTNVPHFCRTFLGGEDPSQPNGLYHNRSPVVFARSVRTPTLLIGGTLDRISPHSQAVEYFRALKEADVETAIIEYPHEGHNVRSMPATIDAAARMLGWFQRHMPA